jgi:HPt (histidine-containing phosphotransfer) domain-containing protein
MANPAVALSGECEPARPRDFTQPVLDVDVISRLERLGESVGEDLMGNLAALFLADADHQVAKLREALARRDRSAVRQGAHTLRGSSANLGAARLGRVCDRLETAGLNGDLETGAGLLDAVITELGRVRGALGPWLAKQ